MLEHDTDGAQVETRTAAPGWATGRHRPGGSDRALRDGEAGEGGRAVPEIASPAAPERAVPDSAFADSAVPHNAVADSAVADTSVADPTTAGTAAPDPAAPPAPRDTAPDLAAPPAPRDTAPERTTGERIDAAALVVASGLGLRTRRGPVFDDVHLVLPPNSVASLHGPAGSGRTMLLLALTGRAAVTTGTLQVAGLTDPAALRRRTAVAGGVAPLEPELTVSAHEREAQLLHHTDRTLDDPAALLGLPLARDRRIGELTALEATLLRVALAALAEPVLIGIDDADDALTAADREALALGLRTLADSGVAVVAVTTDPLPGADVALDLGANLLTGATATAGPRHGRHAKES